MKFIHQLDQMDCGPSCLSMISSFYGRKIDLSYLRSICSITREGVSIKGISTAANKIGFDTICAKISIENLYKNSDFFPSILYWNKNHFVILIDIKYNKNKNSYSFKIADPSFGISTLKEEEFIKNFIHTDNKGIVLLLSPNKDFTNVNVYKTKLDFSYIKNILVKNKIGLTYIFILLIIGSIMSVIFPFLTQTLIDDGVNKKNYNIVYLVLISQLFMFIGSIFIEAIRNWITLNIGNKISLEFISNFLKKLIEVPVNFFDSKMTGDFNQRILDNDRIENFLTSHSMITIFYLITFIGFFLVLGFYNINILGIYILLTTISIFWSIYWQKKREIIDYNLFNSKSENQESIFEILNGIHEIKINQFEDRKRFEWERVRLKMFKINQESLKVNLIQNSGFNFLNQLKNILVTFMCAILVMRGQLTLGAMLSISYIIGQMNSPINQIISFIKVYQEAGLSFNRLNEINLQKSEEDGVFKELDFRTDNFIKIENLSFKYSDIDEYNVLDNISFNIPKGKTTAIVGSSGSGKTTLLKILLKFYSPTDGQIFLGNNNISDTSPKELRKLCGVVLQDGYIFSDSIEKNIANGNDDIDYTRMEEALRIANIYDFVNSLPLKLKTKIGNTGIGLSGGQKQRIFIARAVYKNPELILFDEATSALDSENEKIVYNNLENFFQGRTVVVIAHRLSTVRNADQIIVLEKGKIKEVGTHDELVDYKSSYYNLVKNQLELA
ncbi:peptidase domain-containing ABC transporter [Faecalibacter sp. WQ 117]|uniref:Peptidase domain-containing ABC transporter n=1 Tax=Faecalibacter rhinopitheci TaxID=2779678 RepID=A0A8J7KB69_9FLAO|nr:peptidase domain-containing ABC transporter [Faecalibacter rhinopitheci]